MSTLRVNTLQNVAGTGQPAMVGAAKAWVNFNGSGTVAIRQAFNVTSITDNGTGNYTVNFTTALGSSTYSIVATNGSTGTTAVNRATAVRQASETGGPDLKSTTQVAIVVGFSALADNSEMNVVVFNT
jgi:hypothetical protein